MTSKFYLTQDEYKKLYSDGAIFNTGLEMNEMKGIWLAWETDPEAIKALLPPALGFVAPVVMTYIVNANTKFAGTYNEVALLLMCQHQGMPAGYLQSMFVEGPGASQAAFFGREMAGMPKKICDSIVIDKDGDNASASVSKNGTTFLECTVKLGEYNTPAGNEIFAGNIVGEVVHGGLTYLMKYNLEQAEDGHMYFDNGRILTTESDTLYETWTPGTATITLTDNENSPWASLPVNQVLAAGFGKYSMFNFTTKKVGDFDVEENIPYLLRARFDSPLFN